MANIAMVLISDIRYDGRVNKEIRSLTAAGHRIHLVLPDWEGNQAPLGNSLVKMHRLALRVSSTPLSNFYQQIRFNRAAEQWLKQLQPDFIHCHDLNTLLAGAWAKPAAHCRLIYDAHELFPESYGGIRERVWTQIESWCLKRVDCVIMPEKNRIDYFKKKYAVDIPFILLENFPSIDDIAIKQASRLRSMLNITAEKKIVLYTGGVMPGRGIEDLVQAIPHCSESIVLVVLGKYISGFDAVVSAMAKRLNVEDRVYLHGPIPNDELMQIMAGADVGVAFYRNTNVNNYYCASNKLYEFIGLNKSVITNAHPGLLEVVEQNALGICLSEVNAQSLSTAIERAVQLAETAAKKLHHYVWEAQEHQLLHVYADAAKPAAGAE